MTITRSPELGVDPQAFVLDERDEVGLLAQDEVAPQDVSFAPSSEEEGLLSEEELDALVAPVALYPDALLTQILVAATYPIDVMKADRFVGQNEGRPVDQRPGDGRALLLAT